MSSPVLQTNPKEAGRLAWVDQLRTLVIVLVVNMHACVTYSHVGSWYVKDGPDLPLVDRLLFVFWQGHLQAFFMGILFLLAGYFAHGSLERRGAPGFVRERLLRLGLPTLLYMAAIHPLIILVINPGRGMGPLPREYAAYVLSSRFLGGTGPMWFAAALLGFSASLAGWRGLRRAPAAAVPAAPRAPGPGAVIGWGAALVAATFIVRTVQPVGTSVLNMQLCYFAQYVLAFAAGVAAARGRWLDPLARSPLARTGGWAAVALGPVGLAAVLWASGILKGAIPSNLLGGWHLASLGFSAWEQLAGLGLGLGALAFCSASLNRDTPLSRWLAQRSFGVYLLHPPILVAITIALRRLDMDSFFKVSILTGTGLAGSFLAADLARRVPGLRSIV
jgi:peptidoglycan/LPS O-acetylase OafA/YrhL